LFYIDHHVAVRSGRSSGKGFQEKLRSPGQGLPDLDNLDPREKHLIMLDDPMDETDQRVASLFTEVSVRKPKQKRIIGFQNIIGFFLLTL
jgi:hypothetical protein